MIYRPTVSKTRTHLGAMRYNKKKQYWKTFLFFCFATERRHSVLTWFMNYTWQEIAEGEISMTTMATRPVIPDVLLREHMCRQGVLQRWRADRWGDGHRCAVCSFVHISIYACLVCCYTSIHCWLKLINKWLKIPVKHKKTGPHYSVYL